MLKFDADEAWEKYQDECTKRYHGQNYEAYKKRHEKLLKEEEKIFRKDGCLYGYYKDYYDFIDYEHEIDMFKFYGYKEYINNFYYRREDAIEEEINPYSEDDDR